MFLHDFVHVDRPLDAVLDVLPDAIDPWLRSMVAAAWQIDREEWVRAGLRRADLTPSHDFHVELGSPRIRVDGMVVPIAWRATGARLVPDVEADLEIARCGANRCDLQIMGRYELPPDATRTAAETSLAHRMVVNAVRRFLELLATRLRETVEARETDTPRRPHHGRREPGDHRVGGRSVNT